MTASAVSFDGAVPARGDQAVGLWLFAIAALIALMVVIGGLTRLTGSGLSITEWQPVTGAIPPLDQADWQAEFAKYKGTPQYELLNRGMGLAAFKTIYLWEWTHRLLGRILGVVFLAPFLMFLWQKRIDNRIASRLAVIFLLGAAQGALGWWMVQSGLSDGRVVVSQYRLAAHLGLATILFGYVFWTGLEISGAARSRDEISPLLKVSGFALCGLVFVQMLLGAFMAGLDAGRAFNTWPSYVGRWIPVGLFDLEPWWRNHFENHAMVHFQHRTVAYLVVLAAVALFWRLRGTGRPTRIAGTHVLVLTAVQFALGVFTVLSSVALPLAALHQICALALFASTLWWAFTLVGDGYSAGTVRRFPISGRAGEGTSA
jgi:cytochrome c oxidase assembly protein subunit 15